MVKHWTYCFLLFGSFTYLLASSENGESQKKKIEIVYPTMAPNSKFLNPHVDDATNLQFAIGAFEGETKKPEGTARDVLTKLSESLNIAKSAKNETPTRTPKSLDNWKLIPFLNSIIKGYKDYKFKNV